MTTASASREQTVTSSRVRLGAVSLALSGILFVLNPLLRPFSNEASLQGAAAFASTAWILAHLLGVLGFILIALGLLGLSSALQHTAARRLASVALVLTWIGVGLILPYHGAEMFGLRALGQEALRQHSSALLSLVDTVRLGPGAIVFVLGLLLLAVGAILVAIAVWRSGTLSRRQNQQGRGTKSLATRRHPAAVSSRISSDQASAHGSEHRFCAPGNPGKALRLSCDTSAER